MGDCTSTLASGSTCQPTCDDGYTVSGTVTDADTAGFTFSKAIAGTANLAFDTIQESTQETSYVYWLRLKTKPEEAVTFTVTEDCTADLSLTYSNCGIFTIRLDDSVTTTHTFAAKTDHVTTETALKVTLTIPADTHETGLHPPPRSSNLKISVASGDARYASLPPHTLALTITDKLYVEKLEEPIDTTAAATEETTVNNSDGVVLVKIPANAIPQEILALEGLKIDVETAIIEAEEGSNILAIEDATKYETKTSIIEYKMTSFYSTADLSVSFASPVELTIPLYSSDCLAEGAYCQCMRADSKMRPLSGKYWMGSAHRKWLEPTMLSLRVTRIRFHCIRLQLSNRLLLSLRTVKRTILRLMRNTPSSR